MVAYWRAKTKMKPGMYAAEPDLLNREASRSSYVSKFEAPEVTLHELKADSMCPKVIAA